MAVSPANALTVLSDMLGAVPFKILAKLGLGLARSSDFATCAASTDLGPLPRKFLLKVVRLKAMVLPHYGLK
jgi:hypothetical protein